MDDPALPVTPTIELRVDRRSLPGMHPLAVYQALRETYGPEHTFLLESLSGPSTDNRFSLCGVAGRVEVTVRRGLVAVTGEEHLVEAIWTGLRQSGLVNDADHLIHDNALWHLGRVLGQLVTSDDPQEDLALSFLTFFGYDAARYIEVLPRLIEDSPQTPPDAVFSLVETLITFAGQTTNVACISSPWTGEDLDALEQVLAAAPAHLASDTPPPVPEADQVADDITVEEYLERGLQCLEHIRVGDIYQVQLGHSITVTTPADPLTVYERLRIRNPSSYMGLVPVAGFTVVSASPELFVRLEDGRAVMRPIAGTAQRGENEDAIREELLNNPKERAEHLMLVDLCRNDLGRISRPGSVAVETLMAIETYSHVFHIVSQVSCELAAHRDVYDVIWAGFPAGTMSGAPKVRAMEIIENLETSRRGFYAGAFGLIGANSQQALLGLAIRMAVHHNQEYTLRASAGFVADSTPMGEWNETLSKLAATYWAVCGKEIR